jgi:peptidoglycan/xylan/chitin deacetylase (PgdA/CDA1 family)
MKKRSKIFFIATLFLASLTIAVVWYFNFSHRQWFWYPRDWRAEEFAQLKVAKDEAKILQQVNLEWRDKDLASDKYHTRFGILMYHHINFKHSKLAVRPEIFEEQIKFLLSRGYRFVKLSDAFKTFASSASSSSPYDKTLVLTFDDGYRDFYLNAYPILKKYNVPASFYVINQDIGRPGNVTMEMIKNLHQEGLVEIGAHTVNHLALGRLKPEAAFYQMIKSKELLERELNTTIETIIYPFGSFNANVKKQAQQIGFLGGASVYFGQRPSSQDLFAWRRVMITNSDLGQILLRKIFIAFEVVK